MEILFFKTFLPEIFFSFSILFFLIFNVYLTNNIYFNFPLIEIEIFNQLLTIFSVVLLLFLNVNIEIVQNDSIFFSSFGTLLLKELFICYCILSLSTIVCSFKINKLNLFEYFVVYLFTIFASLILISSSDLILIYLLLELQTLAFFVLSCFDRQSTFSTEAGLKYFVLGSFVSAIFLCGCVFLYGFSGTLNLNSLILVLNNFDENFSFMKFICLSSSILILITFFFKIAAAPFHFWVADIYEGAPLSSTVIFSIIPKISLFYLFIKWILIITPSFSFIKYLLLFSGILTIFLGSILALKQKRLKRLIIYSSIAQGGFLIAGCSNVTNIEDISFIFFFLSIYLISSILIWLQFSFFYTSNYTTSHFFNQTLTSVFISNLSNFFPINKVAALSFIFIFFSLAGLPPFCGFLTKVFIIKCLTKINIFSLNFLLIIVSVFSTFYYLKILKVVFFEFKLNLWSIVDDDYDETFLIFTNDSFSSINYIITSFLLFLLVYFFISPTLPLILLEYIVLTVYIF
jgi:proton-translocating NADH-quinone oxidoreductase chain N